MKALAFGVLFLAASMAGTKSHNWQTGRVTYQHLGSRDKNVEGTERICRGSFCYTPNTITLEANGYRYSLEEDFWHERINTPPLLFVVNSDVQFYEEKSIFVFLDGKKKEHKFTLFHIEKLSDGSTP